MSEAATSCWVTKGSPAPDTTGLYDRFTDDQFRTRLETIVELSRGYPTGLTSRGFPC